MMKYTHLIRRIVGAGILLAIISAATLAQETSGGDNQTSPPENDTPAVTVYRHPTMGPAPANDDPNWPRVTKKLMDDFRDVHEASGPFTPPSYGDGPPVRSVQVLGDDFGISFRVFTPNVHQPSGGGHPNSRYHPKYPNPSGYMSRFIFSGQLKDFGTYTEQGMGEPLYHNPTNTRNSALWNQRYAWSDWVSVRADLVDGFCHNVDDFSISAGRIQTGRELWRTQYALDAPYFACLIMNMDSDGDGEQDPVAEWGVTAFVLCYSGWNKAVVYHTDEDWPNPYYVNAAVSYSAVPHRSIRFVPPNPNVNINPPWTYVRNGHRAGDPGLPYWDGDIYSASGRLLTATAAYTQEKQRADDLQSQVQALQNEVTALKAAQEGGD